MKKILTLLPFFLMFFVFGYSQSLYQIKSAKIDFVFSNGFQTGAKTLVFTDSGKTEKVASISQIDTSILKSLPKEVSATMTGSKILIIQNLDSIFTIELVNLIGSRRKRVNMGIVLSPEKKTETIGSETFLNRLCDIIEFQGFKIWYWKGIALKKEMALDADHTIYEYAISIDEQYTIKADEFNVPTNIRFK